jgi:hypothetical protein
MIRFHTRVEQRIGSLWIDPNHRNGGETGLQLLCVDIEPSADLLDRRCASLSGDPWNDGQCPLETLTPGK